MIHSVQPLSSVGDPWAECTDTIQRELAEKTIRFTNSRSKLIFKPLPQDDPRQRQPDLAEAKALLNWEPKVALDGGLKQTIAYFKRSLELS